VEGQQDDDQQKLAVSVSKVTTVMRQLGKFESTYIWLLNRMLWRAEAAATPSAHNRAFDNLS